MDLQIQTSQDDRMISKYEFIQILTILRDKMINEDDAQLIHETMVDLMEMDQAKVKEKYNLF